MRKAQNCCMRYIGQLLACQVVRLDHRNRFIRSICVLILILFMCVTFAGCQNRDSIQLKDHRAPYSVVFHSIPFASGNKIWDEAELLEKDRYGRELYFYTVVPEFNPAASDYSSIYCYIYALVICQRIDENSVYYYEDQCYLLTQNKDYSADDLASIKEANDWDKPYDENRLTAVVNSFNQTVFANKEKCLESFSNTVRVDDKYELVFDEITTKNDESLCVIREYYSTPNDNNGKDYFFGSNYIALFDKDSNLIRYSAFKDTFDKFPKEILAFKDSIAQVA